jgi:predicted unusual protein kinase regulating ubiquinone biosynthesis (AarF/ABC1/UbiB family)/nucleotide-binding universal stress UspA family protein
MVERIVVATDRSPTARQAVTWAADIAERFAADLLVVQVVADDPDGQVEPVALARATRDLERDVAMLAGPRARCQVVAHADPAEAIIEVADAEDADLLVVGSVGMRDRTQFLLHNVPNRVSHAARCSVVIVQTTATGHTSTAGSADDETKPCPPPESPDVEDRLLARAARVGGVFAKLGVQHIFGGDSEGRAAEATNGRGGDRPSEARRLRDALEELGPTFAKLGQLLSTRPDLLPSAFVEELASLQDHVTPLTEAEVVSVMEEELGVPWEDVFETIDPQPLAAGTIAQVHRATLSGGERVVIKVQRPTARDDILTDLALLERFAEKTERRRGLRQVADIPAIVGHLSSSLRRELDFTQEAANIERLRQALAPFSRLDVPGVRHDISTSRLLVMEDIQGVPLRQAPDDHARREAGRQMLESYYRQMLTEGFFHADPHPGNLLWWNDKLYFLDCGMVGELGPEVRELLLLVLLAFWQQDAPFLAEVLLLLAGEEGRVEIDLAAFVEELAALLQRYRNLALRDIQLGPVLQEISEISLRHAIRLPASLFLAGKALAQMQLVTAELDASLDALSVAGSFLLRNAGSRIRKGLDPKHLFYETQKLQVRSVRLIEAIERLVGARPGPKLQVHFRGTERLEETVRRASRHLALALTASGALVGAAITANSRVARWVPAVLGGTGGALTTGLVADLVRGRR